MGHEAEEVNISLGRREDNVLRRIRARFGGGRGRINGQREYRGEYEYSMRMGKGVFKYADGRV